MTSNKFAGSAPNTKPPAVCKSPKIPWPPVPPDSYPTQLIAFAQWTDLDPLAPFSLGGIFNMAPIGGPTHFAGSFVQAPFSIHLDLAIVPASLLCTVTFRAIGPIRVPPGDQWQWAMVPIQLSPILATNFLYDYHLPNKDFREVQIVQQAWST